MHGPNQTTGSIPPKMAGFHRQSCKRPCTGNCRFPNETNSGLEWDNMGYYGRQWDNYGILWVNKGFRKVESGIREHNISGFVIPLYRLVGSMF